MLKKILVGTILATLSSATLAAAPGFYLEGQLGWSKANYSTTDSDFVNAGLTSSGVDTSGLGGRVGAGYQFNQNWAAELGYTRYANVKYKNTSYSGVNYGDLTLKNSTIDIVGKGILPLDNGFNVFGKLGLAYAKVSADFLGSRNVATDSKWRPTYGVGAGYDFNQNVTADVSWMRVQKGGDSIRNLDLISAGVAYHFG